MPPSMKSDYKAPSKIIGIQFSMLSPEEIRKNSVVEITSRDTYNNNKPLIGGLFDPRMGVLEPGIICPTDGLTYIDTPWEADDLRDRPEERLEMFNSFEKALKDYNRPYILLKGDKKERLEKAVKHIDKLLNKDK